MASLGSLEVFVMGIIYGFSPTLMVIVFGNAGAFGGPTHFCK